MLRRASVEDAERIARLHIASWRRTYVREMPAAFLDGLDVVARTAKWQQQLKEGVRVVVAEDGVELMGYVACGPARDTLSETGAWEIYNLHVISPRQRQGIGSALFTAAVGLGRDAGAQDLVLWVVDSNSNARSFYERKGMKVTGRRQERFVVGEFCLHEVLYRKRLSGDGAWKRDVR
jgi:ribosomal protein S18 acetylase RimI-like enzyme